MKLKIINIRKQYGIYVLINPNIDFKFINIIRDDFVLDWTHMNKFEFNCPDNAVFYIHESCIYIGDCEELRHESEIIDEYKNLKHYRTNKYRNKKNIYNENKFGVKYIDWNIFDVDDFNKNKTDYIFINNIVYLSDYVNQNHYLTSLYDDFIRHNLLKPANGQNEYIKKHDVTYTRSLKKRFKRYMRICENPYRMSTIPLNMDYSDLMTLLDHKFILSFPKEYIKIYIDKLLTDIYVLRNLEESDVEEIEYNHLKFSLMQSIKKLVHKHKISKKLERKLLYKIGDW